MKKVLIFSLLILAICGCSKKQPESIFMICDGVEYSRDNGVKSPETKVQRVIQLSKNQSNTWHLFIDNVRVISDIEPKNGEIPSDGILVKEDVISGFQDLNISQNKLEKYGIDINRISGHFTETLDTPSSALNTSYVTRTEGQCKKVDRKI